MYRAARLPRAGHRQGHAAPQAPRRRCRGDRRRRGPEGPEGRVGAGRPAARRQDTGRLRQSARARGLAVRAATQKCRRAKRLTPAWPPPPSPSAPPSQPRPRVPRRRRRRRQRRGRRFFFKAAPPKPGLGPLSRQGARRAPVHGSPAVPGGPEGDLQRPRRACGPLFPFKPAASPPLARPAAYRLALRPPPPPENGPRRSHNAPGALGSLKRRLNLKKKKKKCCSRWRRHRRALGRRVELGLGWARPSGNRAAALPPAGRVRVPLRAATSL